MEYIDGYLPTESSKIRALARSVIPLPCITTGRIISLDPNTDTASVQPDHDCPLLPSVKLARHVTASAGDRCLLAFADNDLSRGFVIGLI